MTKDKWLTLRPWSRHSLILVVAGFSYILIGISMHYYTPGSSRWEALIVARHVMPLDAWVVVFILVGLMAIASSRWPPLVDSWGYAVLTGFSAGWGMFYLAGIIFINSSKSNVSIGIAWLLIAFMWWAISGLINPVRVVIADGKT